MFKDWLSLVKVSFLYTHLNAVGNGKNNKINKFIQYLIIFSN